MAETNSLFNIKINGSFVIGSKDSLTENDAKGFMEKINSYTKNPQNNEIIVIPDASHIFYGKHEQYANVILNIVKRRVYEKVFN